MQLFVLILLFAGVVAQGAPRFNSQDFWQWFEAHETADSLLQGVDSNQIKRFRFVLVRGYLNELLFGYMQDNRDALLAFGVPASQIHFVSPASIHSIQEDSKRLLSELTELARLGDEKLVLIGHSKGAAALVAFALQHPGFIHDHVEGVFPIQGVFGGSGVADALYHWGAPQNPIPFWGDGALNATLFSTFALMARPVVSVGKMCGYFQGMRSLTHEHNGEFWSAMRAQCRTSIPLVAEHTVFLGSTQHPSEQTWMLKPSAWYLHYAYGGKAGDGLVFGEEQSLPWLSVRETNCVVTLGEGNHHSFTHRGLSSNSSPEARRRFMAALARGLAIPE